jgi:hypothetical protein
MAASRLASGQSCSSFTRDWATSPAPFSDGTASSGSRRYLEKGNDMNLTRASLAVVCVSLCLGASAKAMADCESVCNESSPCSKVCFQDGQKMTCGGFGVCQPSCTPNYVLVDSRVLGTYDKSEAPWGAAECHHGVAVQLHYRDVSCGQPDGWSCEDVDNSVDQGCCWFGCFGTWGTACNR